MNLYSIDLHLLVVFDALMAEKSVTAAAARIGLSQPAMSNALRRLRDLFNDPLLVRTTSGMRPTARAAALAAPIRQALLQVQSTLQPPQPFVPARSHQTFTVAATDYAELVFLPRLMQRLATEAPGINLSILPVGADVPRAALETGRVDAVLGPFTEAPPDVHVQRLFAEHFVCLVRTQHPEVREHLTLEQFIALPQVLISARGATPGRVDDALAQQGLPRRVALWVPHFLVVPVVVAQTNLLATLSRRVVQFFVPYLPLRVLPLPLPLPGYDVTLMWHECTHDDPAQQWFRHLLAEVGHEV
jgi:DNA-binding transcriptional LysR family regulator